MRSISSIASPELVPGAGWPEISNAGTPWKRELLLGVVDQPILAKAEKGDISPPAERTNHWPRSSGLAR